MTEPTTLKDSMDASAGNAKALFRRVDEERLRTFIEGQPDVTGPVALAPLVYPGGGAGASNGIAFVTATLDRGAGRETIDLVLRYDPGVQLLRQKTFEEEFLTLQAVARSRLPVPRVLWLDRVGAAIGQAGYLMERVVGETPSTQMFSAGPLAGVAPEVRRERMLLAADLLGAMKREAIQPSQVPHLIDRGFGETAIERELSWQAREVELLGSVDERKRVRLAALRAWLTAHQPRDLYPPQLVHGDTQIANMIYRDGRIAALIDWELAYLGCNETDLALLVLLTETQQIVDLAVEGAPSEAEYIARYEAASGTPVVHWRYFVLFNLYRVMSIMSLVAHFMPGLDQVWEFHDTYVERAWLAARAEYGE